MHDIGLSLICWKTPVGILTLGNTNQYDTPYLFRTMKWNNIKRRRNRGGNGGAGAGSAETTGVKVSFLQESTPEEPKMHQNSWRPGFAPDAHFSAPL